MELLRSVVAFAPVSELSCTLPETQPRASPSSYSRALYDRIKCRGKLKRNHLNKSYIGSPTNFKHLCHVEWSHQTGFGSNLDLGLKMIFAEAGITQVHLKDKRISKKIFETIEKQGGVEAVLKEAKAKGFLTKPLDPTEVGLIHSSQNELDCQASKKTDGLNNVPTESFFSSKSCTGDNPSVVTSPAPSTSPLQRSSQQRSIQNLTEVQLKRARSDTQPTPLKQDDLMYQIRKGTPLKPISHNPPSPCERGIIAALKDVIQKRHKAIHASDDEESDLEIRDEWDD